MDNVIPIMIIIFSIGLFTLLIWQISINKKRWKRIKKIYDNVEADILDEVMGLNHSQEIAVKEFFKKRKMFL